MPAMRPARLLLGYLVLVFIGGALLAPCLYWAAQAAAGAGPLFKHLAGSPFHRFLDRALLGMALLGLVPLLRQCGMFDWAALGLAPSKKTPRQLLAGFFLGFVSLGLIAAAACLTGARAVNASHSAADWVHRILTAALTVILVAVIEEIIFRGALFEILRKSIPWPAALVFSSALYALVHFIQKADTAEPVRWNSGLILLGRMFHSGGPFVPAFFTLLAAGAILALAYQRSGALYFSIGLHGGWIFWLKSYRFITQEHGGSRWWWGTDNLIDGWLAFFLLVIIFLLMARNPARLAKL